MPASLFRKCNKLNEEGEAKQGEESEKGAKTKPKGNELEVFNFVYLMNQRRLLYL